MGIISNGNVIPIVSSKPFAVIVDGLFMLDLDSMDVIRIKTVWSGVPLAISKAIIYFILDHGHHL